MSDDLGTDEPRRPQPPGQGPHGEPIGSVGEEAAKLFTALSVMARDLGAGAAGAARSQGDQGSPGGGPDVGPAAGAAAGAAFALGDLMKDVNDHIATGGEDCRYCPVCQVISAVRATSPEVKAHLALAASSLMHAAAGVLATQVPEDRKSGPVEKINLDDESWDDHE